MLPERLCVWNMLRSIRSRSRCWKSSTKNSGPMISWMASGQPTPSLSKQKRCEPFRARVANVPASAASRNRFQRVTDRIGLLWQSIWFQDSPTTPLEISRIGIGAAMLLHYILATPYLFTFWGDDGWMPRTLLTQEPPDAWAQSILFYLTSP